jgi:L-ribulose-5-phosphate 3-epimerase UlaE
MRDHRIRSMEIDRRRFLIATTGVAALGAFGLAGAVAQPAGEKRRLAWGPGQVRKALKFGMIKEGDSIAEKLAAAGAAGFHGVEFDSPHGMDNDEIISARDSVGIEIPGVVCSTHWSKPLSHPDPAVRMEGRHGLERAILDSRAMGGTTVLLVPAVVNAGTSYADAWDRSMQEIRAVLPMAEDVGVQILLENVWNNFLLSPVEARRYVDELNDSPGINGMTPCVDGVSRPTVAWYFDVGNIWHYGWPAHWLEALNRGHGHGRLVGRLDIKGYSRAKADKEANGPASVSRSATATSRGTRCATGSRPPAGRAGPPPRWAGATPPGSRTSATGWTACSGSHEPGPSVSEGDRDGPELDAP